MVSSMTGYGRGQFRSKGVEVSAEIRSVNNRYLDIVLKLPRVLNDYDQKIRELIGRHLSRGRISVTLTITSRENPYETLSLNMPLVETYVRLAREINKKFRLRTPIDVNQLIALPDVILSDAGAKNDDRTWQYTEKALTEALIGLADMRQKEGENLLHDFQNRIRTLDQRLEEIETIAATRPRAELEKLRSRITGLVQEQRVDEQRLELEMALLADRLDITEECVRFHSHNKEFLAILERDEAPGRKLNFLLQEMHREINTIGSKAVSAEISHRVVEIKEEIEKLREQVQNIE